MVRITEDLVRKRAEHNECEIFSLEELSLHQQDLEKIEHLQTWCRDLKILYLQNNVIAKIENVGKLKKLEYLNLALNNIERVENLRGCESLKKLDLTVNFIGELSSISSLKSNIFLEEIYLTGNPCTQFEGYQEYVYATLPQLKRLDGNEIDKSERIKALQNIDAIKLNMKEEERKYFELRKQQIADSKIENVKDTGGEEETEEEEKKRNEEFWNETCDYTPESRLEMQNRLRENKEKGSKSEPKPEKKRRRFFTTSGEPLNVNEAKVDFQLTENDDDSAFILDVSCYKFLDTSLIDLDVEPWYVRVTMKGQVLQLVLFEEVKPDSSTAQRSQITGHLIVTLPKLHPPPVPAFRHKQEKQPVTTDQSRASIPSRDFLEVKDVKTFNEEIGTIVADGKGKVAESSSRKLRNAESSVEPASDFVDDPDVPPLI